MVYLSPTCVFTLPYLTYLQTPRTPKGIEIGARRKLSSRIVYYAYYWFEWASCPFLWMKKHVQYIREVS